MQNFSHDSRLTTHGSPHGRVLIIAGSDSGGGAGIQGDLKTVQALGGYGMTAITALTAQNTLGVFGIHPVPEDFIAQQISLCLEDICADAIKTGMLHSAGVIETVARTLDAFFLSSPPAGEPNRPCDLVGGMGGAFDSDTETKARQLPPTGSPYAEGLRRTQSLRSPTPPQGGNKKIPLVVDPVMVAKGGAALLEQAALEALKTFLIPRATLITPNLPEAEMLLGRTIGENEADLSRAAEDLLKLGAQSILIKGGHGDGAILTDYYRHQNGETLSLATPRVATRHTHGTGCAFASAIATGLAQQQCLKEAIARAHAYVQAAIARAPGFGQGNGPLGH